MASERNPSTPGRRPYGDEPGESIPLRIIRTRRARGWTWWAIARLLNERGYSKRNGKPWCGPSVAGVHR